MQFNFAVVLAAMASVAAAAETVTVYACESTSTSIPSGVASPTTVASTGVVSPPTPTGSPIFEGAASVNAASAFGLVVAGGLALLI